MPWGAAAAAAATVAGSYLSGQAAKSAAETSAAAQRDASAQAAEAARFKPYGVTTGFGTSTFGDQTASYTLTPELQAIRDRMLAQAGAYDTTQTGALAQPLNPAATSLFNLGQQYLATSPEQAAQDYMAKQRNLLAPGYEQALAGVRNQQFQTGRTGLGVGGTSVGYGGVGSPGLLATNPEMQALYNARAQQEADIAAKADIYGQQRAQFGAGLFGTGANLLSQVPSLTTQGYGPLQTQLGLAGTIEGYGQQALDIGAQLGGRSATAGQTVANALLTGGTNAARTAQAGQAYSMPGALLQGAGSNQALNSWFQNRLNQPSSTPNWSNPYQYNTAYTDQGATGGAYGIGTGGFE
jgi:hypothetical protein